MQHPASIVRDGLNHWGLYLGLVCALILLGSGCAKSQPDTGNGTSTPDSIPVDSFDEFEFEYIDEPDTFRTRYGEFELVEVEDELYDELVVWHEGKALRIVEKKDGKCLYVAEAGDFDSNGYDDILVGINLACDSNSYASSYFIVAQDGHGNYCKTNVVGQDWNDPVIAEWQGKWSVLIESPDDDFGNLILDKKVERFILKDGKLELVETIRPKEKGALMELRISAYDSLDENAALTLEYDLDGDGRMDRITARLWKRWDRLLWSIHFGNGKEMLDGTPAKRLGILPTVTGGFHELVVDYDRVLEWTGKRYEEKQE